MQKSTTLNSLICSSTYTRQAVVSTALLSQFCLPTERHQSGQKPRNMLLAFKKASRSSPPNKAQVRWATQLWNQMKLHSGFQRQQIAPVCIFVIHKCMSRPIQPLLRSSKFHWSFKCTKLFLLAWGQLQEEMQCFDAAESTFKNAVIKIKLGKTNMYQLIQLEKS